MRYCVVKLRVLIPGNTKNRCDATFGLVKKRLKTLDIDFPTDMMSLLGAFSRISSVVEAESVGWTDWKALMKQYFMIPSKFKINTYYIF